MSEADEAVLRRLAGESKVSLDEIFEALEVARRLVDLGHARLAVVAYLWGLEFELEITESGRALIRRPAEVLPAQKVTSNVVTR